MARSSAIYVAKQDNVILACFTVKHELATWYRRLDMDKTLISLWRYRDNPGRGNPEVDVGVKVEIN